MKHLGIDRHSLTVQMILGFVTLVLLTAGAVGVPAIWLIRHQLERQAWAQVEQGQRAAQALYLAQQTQLDGLATLTSQRPTLQELLARSEPAALTAYLRTLQAGAGLDLVLVCDAGGRTMGRIGDPAAVFGCDSPNPTQYQVVPGEAQVQVWLLAAHPIGLEGTPGQGRVIVGQKLGQSFVVQMQNQTGLDHTLLVAGQPVASSLGEDFSPPQVILSTEPAGPLRREFWLDERHAYYAQQFPLLAQGEIELNLAAEVALPVADITATQQRLVWTLGGGILIVAVLASGLGLLLTRRISQPLARLTQAATALSQGNLDSSLAIQAQVREVAVVARAIERARLDLLRTLAELQQEKAWIDHLLEAIVEGIVTLDQSGRITFFSHGAERITGWSRTEVVGRACDEVFQEVETHQPFSRFIPPPGRRRKIIVALADQRPATLSITGARLMPPEAGDARVALVFRDVSEEEAVHRLMGHFLANVAHEFRTPLSALAASAELLRDQAPELNPNELQELLVSLHLGIIGLQTLVDNLLESASIEAGRFRVHARPSDPGNIILEATRTMEPLAEKHNQRLVLDIPATLPTVRADPRRTIQVLVNLLSNAIKYGPDGAEIEVQASVQERVVQLTIADRGPGIAPEHRQDLFHRFVYPVSEGSKAQYGVGLGLWVVKAVVEAQGGHVGVKDRPGGGSIFWFTLPVEGEP
ncbi:MAG: ATP-binding protein [Chloroflexota bacterium]